MVNKPRTPRRIGTAFGLALIALALGVFASPAMGAEAPPENIASPTLPSAAPRVGTSVTAFKGAWTNGPNTFTYTWYRCNTEGIDCKLISGQTALSYTPVAADEGFTLKIEVKATNAYGSTAVLSPASKVVLGAEAPPVNTALPTLSGGIPHVGEAINASNGSWTNGPTSYAYAWLRCNSSGSGCSVISGKTSSSYTPVTADEGSTLKVEVKATNAYGTGTATSKASAVTLSTPQAWYTCNPAEGGLGFEDSFCSKEVTSGAKYKLSKLTAPTALKMSSTAGTKFSFKSVVGGIHFTITCTSQTNEGGTIENSSGGAAGKISGVHFHLSGCTVPEPLGEGCQLPELNTNSLVGTATGGGANPGVTFSPEAGGVVTSFHFTGCKASERNEYAHTVTGSIETVLDSSSSLQFTQGTSKLLMDGQPAWFEGTSKIETAAGRALRIP